MCDTLNHITVDAQVDSIIKSIWESFKINTEPIKPGRNFSRDKRKKGSRQKTSLAYKPAW